jgi:hypothetical protein
MIFRYCAVAALLLVLGTPALAQWTPQDYSAEYNDCVPACDKNNANVHAMCEQYCRCVIDAAQSAFPDHAQLNADYSQRLPATLKAMQELANGCNQKVFGGPARQLK